MSVVIVRLDLDRYLTVQLTHLIKLGVISVQDACESKAFKSKSELDAYNCFAMWKSMRKAMNLPKAG